MHSDTDSGEDKLDIESEVESLAKVLAYKETDLPLSIGLFGNWGSGKSFFMKKLQKSVTNFSAKENSKYYNRIAQIEFNAWHYAESNLWASLVYNIFANLEEDSSKDEVMILLNSLDEKLKIKKNELEKLKKESELFVSKFNEIKQKIKDEGVSRSKVIELVFKEFCQPKNKQNNEEIDRWAKIAGLIPKEQKEIQLKEIYEKSKEHEQLSILNKLKRRVKGYSFLILCISGVIGVIYLLPYIYNICKETYLIKIFIETYPSLKELFEAILKMFLFIPFPPVVYKIWESWSNKNIFWSTPILEKMRNTFLEFEKKIVKEEEEITNRLKKLDDEKNYYDNLIKEKTIQIDDIEKEKENTTYEKALSSFIKNRTESNDYVKHLGLPSIIRKDFKTLSNLIQKFNNEKENAENKGIPINRIILYIDDLDRCPYEKVVKVLEAVHLLLAFKAFIVVVAVDERWVSNALKVKYKDFFNANSKSATPQDYLEKIFQIPYWIKPMNSKGRIDILNHLMPLKVDPDNNKDNPEAKLGDTNETIAYSNPLMDNFIEGITSYNKSPEIQEVEEVELSFTKEEKNFIKEVEGLMGSTPRDIKRFVNIYLLIKAGAEEKLESNKIYDLVKMRNIKGNLFNYECIMFLLAIVIGMPKSGKYFFQYLRNVNNNIPFLDGFHEFIEKQPKLDGDKISIQNEIANFTNWMNRNANRIIEEQNFDQLQYWDSFVSRYSFDAEVHKSES